MAEKRGSTEGHISNDASKRQRTENGPASGAKMSIKEQLEIAKARARAAAIAAGRGQDGSRSAPAEAAPPSTTSAADAARSKMEEIRARIQAAKANAAQSPASVQRGSSIDSVRAPNTKQQYESADREREDEQLPAPVRSGLGIALHPALLGDLRAPPQKNKKAQGSKQKGDTHLNGKTPLDLSGPSKEEIQSNPYFDPALNVQARSRKAREIRFNEKGKFVAQAMALRRQAQMEEMKRRIAETSAKAGLQDDRSEQAFVVKEVPEVEWWDLELLVGEEEPDKRYPDFDEDAIEATQKCRIDTADSTVTSYVQHPVPLEPPQDSHMPPSKPMYMTKEEMAKKRRQDRMEVLKEKQAKVRLGLVPPDPPKIKKSNLMRVLGEQAVKDPTAVEARVNREIAERLEKHEQMNEDRKLTKEQKHEKIDKNQRKDAAKGIKMCVFRIDSLANGQHRYKIDINAKQHALTGMTILNPHLNLVIVEGGEWSMNKYKKLMTSRIAWSENVPPTDHQREKQNEKDITHAWLQPEDDQGQLKVLDHNRCILIWEGDAKDRSFKKWSSRVCETDGEARRALERHQMENMWQAAKNWSD